MRAEIVPGDDARSWLLGLCRAHRLSPAQRRVAQFLADTMPDAAFLSTSEAAARAGVSQPSVTRFAAALGFGSYAEFRDRVREVALGGTASGPRAGRSLPVAADDRMPGAVDEAASTLENLRATLSSPAMAAVVEALGAADTWAFLGLRASTAIARYGAFFAARLVDDVRLLVEADTLLDRVSVLASAGRASVLIVVAMPRYPAATVAALRHASALGLTTVLVVDDPLVDFAADATHVLPAPVGTSLVFDTHTAPILLTAALIDAVAAADPARAQERLEAHEVLVDTWQYRP